MDLCVCPLTDLYINIAQGVENDDCYILTDPQIHTLTPRDQGGFGGQVSLACVFQPSRTSSHTVCNKIDASHKSYSMCVLVWTQGNFCAQGIIHVLKSHKCNPICEALKLRSLVKTFKSPEELGTQMPNAAAPNPLTRGCLPTRLHARHLEPSRYTYCLEEKNEFAGECISSCQG